MALDLESVRAEVQAYLNDSGLAVFYGYHHMPDGLSHVSWDVEQHPDFKAFLGTARRAGAKLIVFHSQAFSLGEIDEALDRLEYSELAHEEKLGFENRLRQLQAYEGFTCAITLSFSIEARTYTFELTTEWYDALTDILEEIDAAFAEEDEEGDGTLGGYFSKN
jgi:hypothetical protein